MGNEKQAQQRALIASFCIFDPFSISKNKKISFGGTREITDMSHIFYLFFHFLTESKENFDYKIVNS